MEPGCSLFSLIACFSWSNFYVDGGLSYQDSTDVPYQEWRTTVHRSPRVTETITQLVTTDEPFNPYGRLAFGYEIQLRSMSFAIEASHRSSLDVDQDRGVNSISLRARWYPFRR